jgi:hypothetical protein
MMALNIINRPIDVAAKLSAIAKIRKYKRFHERHHFIPMATKVHNTPKRDMNRFIKKCARLFHDKQSKSHLSLYFCIHPWSRHYETKSVHPYPSRTIPHNIKNVATGNMVSEIST